MRRSNGSGSIFKVKDAKFDHIYTNQELYEAFDLPQKYRDVIEAVIKERK